MPKEIIYLIVTVFVVGFLVLSFILFCCMFALGKRNQLHEVDEEQEKELKSKAGKKDRHA